MTAFDNLAIAYDGAIEWEDRLKREIPFLLNCIYKADAKVLDMACGSGRHAISLAENGCEVTAFDNSEVMIDRAKAIANEMNVQVEFIVAEMNDMDKAVNGKFDLIYCVGNSLSLLNDQIELSRVISLVHSFLTKGGTFVFQVLNFEEIIGTGFRFMPPKSGRLESGQEVIFSRFFDHELGKTHSNLVMSSFTKNGIRWIPEVSTQRIFRLSLTIIQETLQHCGFKDFIVFSDYSGNDFVRSLHRNMIFKIRKK